MKKVLDYLIKNNLTISFAESITGGALAANLISNNDASKVIKESYVLYSNESKSKVLDIPIEIINKYGVVSKEIAELMAYKLHNITNSDICLSTTGYATGKANNHAYIGVYYRDETSVYKLEFNNEDNRQTNIQTCVKKSIEILIKTLNI